MHVLCPLRQRLSGLIYTCAVAQGVGNFFNTGILLILLCVFNVTTVANQKSKHNRLGGVWRTAFGLGLIPIVFMIFYRVVYLRVRTPVCRASPDSSPMPLGCCCLLPAVRALLLSLSAAMGLRAAGVPPDCTLKSVTNSR